MISRANRDPEPENSEDPAVDPGGAQPPQAVQPSQAEETALDDVELLACVEAILFASGEPVPRRRLRRMLKGVPARRIDETLLRLEAELISTGRSFTLVEDAGGLRLMTRAEFAPYVARLRGEKRRVRLSQAAFETLAVIAYRQPMRRADLEVIRGVQCGAILKNLAEWDLIRVVGRDESLGRPLLYGTSKTFLEQFSKCFLNQLHRRIHFIHIANHGEHYLQIIQANTGTQHGSNLCAEDFRVIECYADTAPT